MAAATAAASVTMAVAVIVSAATVALVFAAAAAVVAAALVEVRPGFAAGLAFFEDVDDAQFERQGLTGQRVVQVEGDVRFGDFLDDGGHVLPLGGLERQLESDGGLEVPLGALALDRENALLVAIAVGFGRGDGDGAFLVDVHAEERLVEAGNDVSLADLEAKRITPFAAVENLSVFERPGVMDRDEAVLVHYAHVLVPFNVFDDFTGNTTSCRIAVFASVYRT